MADLSREQVRHVARLARLALSTDEEERYCRQLGEILVYVKTLDELDAGSISPTAHAIQLVSSMRDDVVVPSLSPQAALANAPRVLGSAVAVPKIIE